MNMEIEQTANYGGARIGGGAGNDRLSSEHSTFFGEGLAGDRVQEWADDSGVPIDLGTVGSAEAEDGEGDFDLDPSLGVPAADQFGPTSSGLLRGLESSRWSE